MLIFIFLKIIYSYASILLVKSFFNFLFSFLVILLYSTIINIVKLAFSSFSVSSSYKLKWFCEPDFSTTTENLGGYSCLVRVRVGSCETQTPVDTLVVLYHGFGGSPASLCSLPESLDQASNALSSQWVAYIFPQAPLMGQHTSWYDLMEAYAINTCASLLFKGGSRTWRNWSGKTIYFE